MPDDIQKQRLQKYLEAEEKALLSQEYQEGSRKNRRADLNQINQGINGLLSTGAASDVAPGSRARRVILRDM